MGTQHLTRSADVFLGYKVRRETVVNCALAYYLLYDHKCGVEDQI